MLPGWKGASVPLYVSRSQHPYYVSPVPARTADTQPAYDLARSKAVVFHEIQSNKCACSAEASEAVYSDEAARLFGDSEERVDDSVGGHSTILEREVNVSEASTLEDSC